MCWMALHRGEDALERALRGCQANEQTSGGHSWGYAVATAGGELHLSHGLGDVPPVTPTGPDDAEPVAALGHTRYATVGQVTLQNAHPFEIRDTDGEPVAALAHNGTWQHAPTGAWDDRCDSYYIARTLEDHYRAHPDHDFGELVEDVGMHTEETLTVIHRDGRAWAYAGRYGITAGEDWIRSSGGTPIPEGCIRQL